MPFIVNRQKKTYDVLDNKCLGRDCLDLGEYYHRAPTGAGSRMTSSPPTRCCMRRALHGCPDDLELRYDKARVTSQNDKGLFVLSSWRDVGG